MAFTNVAVAQTRDYGRGDVSRYDGPLPEWSEVGLFLLGGLGLYLLSRLLFATSTAIEKKSEKSSLATSIGCIGVLSFLAAIACLIPLLMWVERIGLALLFLVGAGIVVFVLFTLLKGWLKKL